MKCGVSTACFYPMTCEDALLEIAKYKIPFTEIFVNTFSEITREYVSELKKTADFYGTKFSSLHPFSTLLEPYMLFSNYQRRFEDALELHRYYFEAMNILGAKVFVFHGDKAESAMGLEQYCDRFARLRDIGKEHGIIVAQENVERCKSGSLDFLCNMVKYLDGDVSIVFDNKQAFRSGIHWEEFVDKLHKNIVHVHFSDNNKSCDCLALGKGDVDISKFLSTLLQKGYSGSVIIELYYSLLKYKGEIFESYDKLILS